MENNKSDLSVFQNLYSKKDKNMQEREKISILIKILIFLVSLCIPFIGVAICILWWQERLKDKIFPIIGTIINLFCLFYFFILVFIYLVLEQAYL